MKCSTCVKSYHKTTCKGETRWKMEKIIKEGITWSCKECRNGTGTATHQTNNNNHNNQVQPKKCRANCGSHICTDFLICSKCKHHFHKHQKCSHMSRKQIEMLDRSTWVCLGCQETDDNNPEPNEEQEQETRYKIRQTKLEKINILQ